MTRLERIGAKKALEVLPLWREAAGRDAIVRSLRFGSFAEAFGFMAEIAVTAERIDHHPEWSNVYDRVEVLLTTHSSGGVTARDVTLAEAVDRAASRRGA